MNAFPEASPCKISLYRSYSHSEAYLLGGQAVRLVHKEADGDENAPSPIWQRPFPPSSAGRKRTLPNMAAPLPALFFR